MELNRFDICEAWYLYLSAYHTGQNSPEYARLSRLTKHFKPRQSLRGAADLTSNGLEIYQQIKGDNRPLVDNGDHCNTIFDMWAGHGNTHVLVRANHIEDALESLFEYLDDNAPGILCTVDYDEAARELGFRDAAECEACSEEARDEMVELAESDLTVCGHTTLKNGNAIPSWEWGGEEVKL